MKYLAFILLILSISWTYGSEKTTNIEKCVAELSTSEGVLEMVRMKRNYNKANEKEEAIKLAKALCLLRNARSGASNH